MHGSFHRYVCCRRSQRGASAKSASANGHAASPAQPAEVIITYASQTGTAQEIARNIQAESSQHGVQSKVCATSFPDWS